MKFIATAALATLLFPMSQALASIPVTVLPTNESFHALTNLNAQSLVEQNFALGQYSGARVQIIANSSHRASHLIVQLQKTGTHRIDVSALTLNSEGKVIGRQDNYHLTNEDLAQQPGHSAAASCPDSSVEFIAFAPNNNSLELQITRDVAAAAITHGLKTVTLLMADATRQNYFNYMSCPNLKGNFYDGDANPTVITTYDGLIGANEFSVFRFNYHVVNIWLACEAYNDPMLPTMTTVAQSQKYAAGVNDLLVGPSDNTAKCAMIAGINGKPLTQAFNDCYKQFDSPQDHWGFGGSGSEYFGR